MVVVVRQNEGRRGGSSTRAPPSSLSSLFFTWPRQISRSFKLSSASCWAADTAASMRNAMAASSGAAVAGGGGGGGGAAFFGERGMVRRGRARAATTPPLSPLFFSSSLTCCCSLTTHPAPTPLQLRRMRFQGGVRPAQVLQVALQLVRGGLGVGGLGFQVGAPACVCRRGGWVGGGQGEGPPRKTNSLNGRFGPPHPHQSRARSMKVNFRGLRRAQKWILPVDRPKNKKNNSRWRAATSTCPVAVTGRGAAVDAWGAAGAPAPPPAA